MPQPPTVHFPGFVAKEPGYCYDSYPLIRPGQAYNLTMDLAALCPDCAKTSDAIRLAGGLTVQVQEDKLLVRRGSAAVEVFPHELPHLVDALVEAAAGLVDQQAHDGEG